MNSGEKMGTSTKILKNKKYLVGKNRVSSTRLSLGITGTNIKKRKTINIVNSKAMLITIIVLGILIGAALYFIDNLFINGENRAPKQNIAEASVQLPSENTVDTDTPTESDIDGEEELSQYQTVSPEVQQVRYRNERFGFLISYPDTYDSLNINETEDDMLLTSISGKYLLEIKAGYDADISTPQSLLTKAKRSNNNNMWENIEKNCYELEYKNPKDNTSMIHEIGYILGDKIIYIYSMFPTNEKVTFEGFAKRMISELDNQQTT